MALQADLFDPGVDYCREILRKIKEQFVSVCERLPSGLNQEEKELWLEKTLQKEIRLEEADQVQLATHLDILFVTPSGLREYVLVMDSPPNIRFDRSGIPPADLQWILDRGLTALSTVAFVCLCMNVFAMFEVQENIWCGRSSHWNQLAEVLDSAVVEQKRMSEAN